MPSLLHPAGSRCRRKASRKVTFRMQGAGRRQIGKGYGPRRYGARQPGLLGNRTVRNSQSILRVVTVRVMDADADRLPLVGPYAQRDVLRGGGVKASQAARCTVTVSHPAKPCRAEVPIWLSPPDCHDCGFSTGRPLFAFFALFDLDSAASHSARGFFCGSNGAAPRSYPQARPPFTCKLL